MMGAIFQLNYVVPKISKIENVEAVQAAVHAYLLDKKIIKPELELDYYGMDYYPIDAGFLDILRLSDADRKEYSEQVLGVGYLVKDRHCFQGVPLFSVTCPSCHATSGSDGFEEMDFDDFDGDDFFLEFGEVSEIVNEFIEQWKSGQDEIACPTCHTKHEINQYQFDMNSAFSNFGLFFLEGVSGLFTSAFLQDLQAIIGYPVVDIDYSE
jgi:hypothetical protein